MQAVMESGRERGISDIGTHQDGHPHIESTGRCLIRMHANDDLEKEGTFHKDMQSGIELIVCVWGSVKIYSGLSQNVDALEEAGEMKSHQKLGKVLE